MSTSTYLILIGVPLVLGLYAQMRVSGAFGKYKKVAATVFRRGQVFTVEPGLYYPGIGGARHEDVVTVTRSGCRLLSKLAVPLEI